MTETFELPKPEPESQRRRTGTWVVAGILALAALALVGRSLWRQPVTAGRRAYDAAFQAAAERREAFARLLPGGRIPEPYYLRGAAAAGNAAIVWLRRDRDDAHAFLVSAARKPDGAEVEELLRQLGGERMPSRQVVDEAGVQVEKRPPFVEEFRKPPAAHEDVHPPRGWAAEWEEATAPAAEREDGPRLRLQLTLAEDLAVPFTPYRQDGPYWWSVVDLGAKARSGSLHLVHVLRSAEAPWVGELHGFVSELLQVR